MHRVPDQMADAATKVHKKGEGRCEQHHLTGPGGDGALYRSVGLRAGGRCDQPDHQHHGAEAQNDASDPVDDRQNRRELRPIVLDVG